MATPPSANPNGEPTDAKALIIAYSNRVWRSFLKILPSADSSLLARIFNLYPKILPSRSRRRKPGLPFPLGPNSIQSSMIARDTSRTLVVLEDIMEHALSSLHNIQKSLLFWQSLAEGTNSQKISFMVFQRGPRAFVDGTLQIVTRFGIDGSPFPHLSHSAAERISANIAVLKSLQSCLATFLAQVYLEVNKFGEMLTEDTDKLLPQLLVSINSIFSKLESSISHPPEIYKSGNSFATEGESSCALLFEKLPEIDEQHSLWTDTEIRDAINLIHQNLQRLDSYLSFILISIRDDLFETFRGRHKGVMQAEEVQLTSNILHRQQVNVPTMK